MRELSPTLIGLALAGATLSASPAHTVFEDSYRFVVHEWGTFTSIAGADGTAVQWLPNAGPNDLPCFVQRSGLSVKGGLSGTVRMETPVLYFYATREMKVDVDVFFRQGVITEWFPPATVTSGASAPFQSGSSIGWHGVEVLPDGPERFPIEPTGSHYYAARRTEAAPLRSGSATEKFLFYRGVGRFLPPIGALINADGTVKVMTPSDRPIGDVILFRNHRGRIAYEMRRVLNGEIVVDREVQDQEPTLELERLLRARGLYAAEAAAMLETWRDSWFEEGTRLIYIVPREEVDAVLPLHIKPAPAEIARVFVGRMELASPEQLKRVETAMLANDIAVLRKIGRFLEPIGRRIIEARPVGVRAMLQRRLSDALAPRTAIDAGCAESRHATR